MPIVWFDDASGQTIEGTSPGAWTVTNSDWTQEAFQLASPEDAAAGFIHLRLVLDDQLTSEETISVDVDDVSLREILE